MKLSANSIFTSAIAAILSSALCSPAADARIRVNQVGFLTDGRKQALLMVTSSESNATFQVVGADGAVAFKKSVGDKIGSWNADYANVYLLDFSAVKKPALIQSKLTEMFRQFRLHSKSARARKCSRRCCAIRFSFFKPSATARRF
jgi:hypothetical protein